MVYTEINLFKGYIDIQSELDFYSTDGHFDFAGTLTSN